MSEDREIKNQVFKTDVSIADREKEKQVNRVENVKTEFGLEIPSERVPLPSSGLVYPESYALYNTDFVEIRPMTTREEDILTSQALLKKGTVITELIRACLVNKAINPLDLVIGDRNSLMIAIRISGYGAAYDAEIKCEACDIVNQQAFDLTQLGIKRLEIQPVSSGVNEFSFSLPRTKYDCTFKFLTGRDEEEILITQERQRKQGMNSSNLVTTNLLYTIKSINGNSDKSQISKFVHAMPAADSLALRQYMKENEPGVDMKQEITCSSCGHIEEVSMPLGVNFLWPGAR